MLWEEDVAEPTYSVGELAEALTNAVHRAFPDEVWVRGEIHNISRPPSGHVYFQLVEGHGTTTTALLPVILSARNKGRINETLKRAGGSVRMVDGTEVRIRGRLDWFAPRGQLQLRMTTIDPSYTLGRLAAAREDLMRRLAAEGLLDRNQRTALPLVPLRVGLITSAGSAAAADFLDELRRSGLAFQVTVVDVRVQGLDAARSVMDALAHYAADPPDVVALVRGGGARTDLAAFDHEGIARAIAWMPVPVLTGIGHEIDRSVADEVAHSAYKTPTACAQALVEVVRRYLDRLEGSWLQLAATADRALVRHHEQLRRHAHRAGRSVHGALRHGDEHLHRTRARVGQAAIAGLRSADVSLDLATRRLATRAPRLPAGADRRLDGLEAQLRAVDPARTLARGWSITRTSEGALVRDPADAEPGAALITTVAGGEVRSTVDGDG
jgi:exodeoxyribonuclease VII large subunit